MRALFKPLPSAKQQLRFTIRFKRQSIKVPFEGPVTLTITHGPGLIRENAIDECKATARGLICRRL